MFRHGFLGGEVIALLELIAPDLLARGGIRFMVGETYLRPQQSVLFFSKARMNYVIFEPIHRLMRDDRRVRPIS